MSKELIEAIQSKDPVRISEAFAEAMKEKVDHVLKETRKEVLSCGGFIKEEEDDYEEDEDYLSDIEQDDLHPQHTYRLNLDGIEIEDTEKLKEVQTVIMNSIGERGTTVYIPGNEAQSQFQKVINALNMAGLEQFVCCIPVDEVH